MGIRTYQEGPREGPGVQSKKIDDDSNNNYRKPRTVQFHTNSAAKKNEEKVKRSNNVNDGNLIENEHDVKIINTLLKSFFVSHLSVESSCFTIFRWSSRN